MCTEFYAVLIGIAGALLLFVVLAIAIVYELRKRPQNPNGAEGDQAG